MEELNTAAAVEVIADEGHDTLTLVDLGDTISFSQVADDGEFHNVVLSLDQATKMMAFVGQVLG